MNQNQADKKSQIQLPRKRLYLVFVHYGKFKTADELSLNAAVEEMKYLGELLTPKPSDHWQGFAFVFLDNGWIERLTNKLKTDSATDIADQQAVLRVETTKVTNRVHIVGLRGVKGLVQVLERVVPPNVADPEKIHRMFHKFFAGNAERLKYDAPKVVEAAIRIANIGRNIPVFRFDDDVIFYGTRVAGRNNRETAAKQARESIHHLCARYDELSSNPDIRHFMFSGTYVDPNVGKQIQSTAAESQLTENELKLTLLNNFATRVLFLAKVSLDNVNGQELKDLKGSEYLTIESEDAAKFLRQLKEFGAPPFEQVTSGAGTCINDGAIIELPPYSNMFTNVMWIDDYLKFLLHEKLKHFTKTQLQLRLERVEQACFSQARHLPLYLDPDAPEVPADKQKPIEANISLADVRWHVMEYLPRLIWGCIINAWLKDLGTKDSRSFTDVFYDIVTGKPEDQQVHHDEQSRQKLIEGLEERLWGVGKECLKKLVKCFGSVAPHDSCLDGFLNNAINVTIPVAWMPKIAEVTEICDGKPKTHFGFANAVDDLKDKPIPKLPIDEQGNTKKPEDMNLEESLRCLVANFVGYLEFVSFWRHFVFAVRSLLNITSDYAWLLGPFDKLPQEPESSVEFRVRIEPQMPFSDAVLTYLKQNVRQAAIIKIFEKETQEVKLITAAKPEGLYGRLKTIQTEAPMAGQTDRHTFSYELTDITVQNELLRLEKTRHNEHVEKTGALPEWNQARA